MVKEDVLIERSFISRPIFFFLEQDICMVVLPIQELAWISIELREDREESQRHIRGHVGWETIPSNEIDVNVQIQKVLSKPLLMCER